MNSFNAALRSVCKRIYCSQKTIAAEMGIRQAEVSRWVDPKRTLKPKPENAKRLASIATRLLNEQIREHMKEVKELQRLGRELREAYEAEYHTPGKPSCDNCKHYLGGGCCRSNLEKECAAGDFEAWEARE